MKLREGYVIVMLLVQYTILIIFSFLFSIIFELHEKFYLTRSSACFSSSQHIDDDGLCQTPVSNLSVTCSHNQAVIEINLSACLEYYATVRRLFETGVKSIITVSPLSSPQSGWYFKMK